MTIIKKNIVFIALIIIWVIISKLNIYSAYILPSPTKIINVFYTEILNGSLIKNTYISLLRVFIGFSISFILAFIFGIMFGIKENIFKYFENILEFIRNIPPISLIPLLILWFGIGEKSKIIIISLATFFPMFINIRYGIKNADKKLIEVGKSLGFSKVKIFFYIIMPHSIPNILSGMKIGIGYGFRAIVGAELVAASSGLGFMILDAQQLSRSDKAIVGIITIGIVGFLCDYLFSLLIRKISYYKGNYIEN